MNLPTRKNLVVDATQSPVQAKYQNKLLFFCYYLFLLKKLFLLHEMYLQNFSSFFEFFNIKSKTKDFLISFLVVKYISQSRFLNNFLHIFCAPRAAHWCRHSSCLRVFFRVSKEKSMHAAPSVTLKLAKRFRFCTSAHSSNNFSFLSRSFALSCFPFFCNNAEFLPCRLKSP